MPGNINPEILRLDESRLNDDGQALVALAKHDDAELRGLATASGVSMLVGAPGFVPDLDKGGGSRQNLTLLYEPVTERGGGQSAVTYAKVHLVPFGEYIPFRTLPLLGPLTRYLIPIDFDYSLTRGREWTRFTLKAGEARSYTFATPICFEDTMPEPARRMSFDGSRKTDFLLNVSNDGWFQSVELDQHLQADQLRAVENRIAIARAVNTGDSGFVDSNGRVVGLVKDARTATSIGAVGTLAMTIDVDSRVSVYSRVGDVLPIGCAVAATLMVGWTYVRPRRGRRE